MEKVNLIQETPMYKLKTLSNKSVKGLFYRQNLRPIPKLNEIVSQIESERVKNGRSQIKIKSKRGAAVWKDLGEFMLEGSNKK